MNLLYLINYAGKAGTEKYVAELMRLCSAEGHRCHLCYSVAGELSRRAEAAGYPVLRLDMRPRRVLPAARALAEYCRRERIDVIHAQYPRENVIALLARRRFPGIRVVFTSHLTLTQNALWRAVNRRLTPENEAVVAVCTEGAGVLRKNGVCEDRIRVIFNGVEPKEPLPRMNRIREEFSLSPDTFVFVTFARYAPEKGLDFLLEALRGLKDRTERPFVCLIAGDGEDFDRIGRRAAALGLEREVLRAGYRRDTPELLASADAYVSSALYNEAMSFAILEAMAQGLPLAVTRVGAGSDLAEGCGLAVEPGDVKALTEGLERLLCDSALCERWGRAAREKALREYDLRRQTEKLLALYRGE